MSTPNQESRQDEAQMAQVRDSLLQHIHSVQKEITRLQAERHRAQLHTQTVVSVTSDSPVVAVASPRYVSRSATPLLYRSQLGPKAGAHWAGHVQMCAEQHVPLALRGVSSIVVVVRAKMGPVPARAGPM